jgi:hypothetical protein
MKSCVVWCILLTCALLHGCRSLAAASHAACNIKRESVAAAPGAKGSSSEGVTIRVKIAHKYLDAQEMEATLEPSGTVTPNALDPH